MFKIISLLVLLGQGALASSPSVSARTIQRRASGSDSPNITVAFFAENQEASCQANDTSQGLVLTTETIPYEFTCFNLGDIFSQSNDTGFKNSTRSLVSGTDESRARNGIHWLLRNRDKYDRQANYSRVWYEQGSNTHQDKAGENGAWSFLVYGLPDCESAGGDDIADEDPARWFKTSCATESGGMCQALSNPIRSFAFSPADLRENEECQTWALFGAATSLKANILQASAISAGVAALFLVL